MVNTICAWKYCLLCCGQFNICITIILSLLRLSVLSLCLKRWHTKIKQNNGNNLVDLKYLFIYSKYNVIISFQHKKWYTFNCHNKSFIMHKIWYDIKIKTTIVTLNWHKIQIPATYTPPVTVYRNSCIFCVLRKHMQSHMFHTIRA